VPWRQKISSASNWRGSGSGRRNHAGPTIPPRGGWPPCAEYSRGELLWCMGRIRSSDGSTKDFGCFGAGSPNLREDRAGPRSSGSGSQRWPLKTRPEGAHGQRVETETRDSSIAPYGGEVPARRTGAGARPQQRWLTFVHNHAKGMVACDFFVVGTATFGTLYVLVILELATRRIVRQNVTAPRPRRGPCSSSGQLRMRTIRRDITSRVPGLAHSAQRKPSENDDQTVGGSTTTGAGRTPHKVLEFQPGRGCWQRPQTQDCLPVTVL
jgi:hypothetical protein